MLTYASQGDLELALGGAQNLRELADPGRSGNIDASIVQDYLESGAAELRSAVEIKHDPETIANMDQDSLRRLRDANAALSARVAYYKGGRGMAMPDFVGQAAERADKYMDDLARGFRRLGRVSGGKVAALNQPAEGKVDYDPRGRGISIHAFRKGFR